MRWNGVNASLNSIDVTRKQQQQKRQQRINEEQQRMNDIASMPAPTQIALEMRVQEYLENE